MFNLGLSDTDETYFPATHFGSDGGISVTASHNPTD
jgi:phosphomannomutase